MQIRSHDRVPTDTQFTVPAAADAVAARDRRPRTHHPGRPPLHLRPDRRAVQPARGLPALPRTGLPHRAVGAGRPRGRPGPAGHLRLQRPRVRRGDARRMAGAGGPVQRQLPLCEERTAVPARGLRVRPRCSTTRRSHRASPRCCPSLPQLRVLIQIADDSGNDLVHGAVDYESIVASGPPQPPPVEPSPDDLYVLYTGGTTGMPKGVLWRQHDIFMTSFGGRNMYTGERHRSPTTRSPSASPRIRAPRS